jgi:integration host factor subunit beta
VAREKLSKAEIVENIYPQVRASKKNIHRIIDLFFDQIKSGLLADRIIELRGLGTFEIRTRKGRKARNPKTGDSVVISDHGVAHFRPGRELKQKVWDLRS